MEAAMGIVVIILVLAALIYFKKAITRTAKFAEDVVTTNIHEASHDLIRRSTEAAEALIEEFGDDYLTPTEAYDLIMRRRQRRTKRNQKNNA